MSESTKRDMHVLVIGAGITGLLIAQGLQKAGIRCSVFESEESASLYRAREWTMGLHWGLPLLEDLVPDDLKARLHEGWVDPTLDWTAPEYKSMRIYNGLDGSILKEIPVQGKIVRASRRRLRALLTEHVDIQYDHQLSNIEYHADGVIAVFANGNRMQGTMIVGCDGPRSAVRTQLLGVEKASVSVLKPIIHVNTSFSYGDVEKARFVRTAHPVWAMCFHPDMWCMTSVQDVPGSSHPESWSFQFVINFMGDRDDFPDAAARLAEVKRRANNICEPFRSAIEWFPDDLDVRFEHLSYWMSEPWDTHDGRVTLAGDAAHPMTPHRGQGLNNAIQDAHNFVSLLRGSQSSEAERSIASTQADLSALLQSYSDEVARRGAEETKLSRQNAFMTLDWNQLKESPLFKLALEPSAALKDGGMEGEGKEVKKHMNGDMHGTDDQEMTEKDNFQPALNREETMRPVEQKRSSLTTEGEVATMGGA